MEAYQELYDLVIVGGGPAGLSAAIYMARAKYRVLVMEKEEIGGQITITSEIVNYPGVERRSGRELTQSMRKQAEAFGAEIVMGEVTGMDLGQVIRVLKTTKGEIRTLGILLATGANPRKLGFVGEAQYQGRGVAYCATCDGEFFTGKEVYVIGGGFAAVEEGIFLTKYASKVTIIVREENFTCARAVADEVKQYPEIEVHFQTEIIEVTGDLVATGASFRNNATGKEWKVERPEGLGIFVFAGYEPDTDWFRDQIALNEAGYIITDETGRTNVDGVYAAGDVRVKELRQVVTAVSDGAAAATALEKYVSSVHKQEEIPELPRKETNLSILQEKAVSQEEISDGTFISHDIREQVRILADTFQQKVIVKASYDDSELAQKMRAFMEELKDISPNIVCRDFGVRESSFDLPVMEVLREDESFLGICFHAVPGGHEFNSFVIALYNAAGPGQEIDQGLRSRIEALNREINVKVAVSLSCTMCPEVVMGVQRAALLSDWVTGEMYDLQYFQEMKEKYQIMSVPCMIVNDANVYFGKKSLEEIVEILEEM